MNNQRITIEQIARNTGDLAIQAKIMAGVLLKLAEEIPHEQARAKIIEVAENGLRAVAKFE